MRKGDYSVTTTQGSEKEGGRVDMPYETGYKIKMCNYSGHPCQVTLKSSGDNIGVYHLEFREEHTFPDKNNFLYLNHKLAENVIEAKFTPICYPQPVSLHSNSKPSKKKEKKMYLDHTNAVTITLRVIGEEKVKKDPETSFDELKERAILAFDADISRHSRKFSANLPEGFSEMARDIRNDLLDLESVTDVIQSVANKRVRLNQEGVSEVARTILNTAMEAFSSRLSNRGVLAR